MGCRKKVALANFSGGCQGGVERLLWQGDKLARVSCSVTVAQPSQGAKRQGKARPRGTGARLVCRAVACAAARTAGALRLSPRVRTRTYERRRRSGAVRARVGHLSQSHRPGLHTPFNISTSNMGPETRAESERPLPRLTPGRLGWRPGAEPHLSPAPRVSRENPRGARAESPAGDARGLRASGVGGDRRAGAAHTPRCGQPHINVRATRRSRHGSSRTTHRPACSQHPPRIPRPPTAAATRAAEGRPTPPGTRVSGRGGDRKRGAPGDGPAPGSGAAAGARGRGARARRYIYSSLFRIVKSCTIARERTVPDDTPNAGAQAHLRARVCKLRARPAAEPGGREERAGHRGECGGADRRIVGRCVCRVAGFPR